MKKDGMRRKFLKAAYEYFLFFLLVAFLVSCTTTLFVTVLSRTLDISLTNENVQTAAKITFLNVILLSVLFTVTDALRRKFTTVRTAKKISLAAKKMAEGDFDVRIPRMTSLGADNSYNEIIDCFNAMAEELSGVETLRKDFIASVSHEMKTPLSVIRNYARLLSEEGLSEKRRLEYAEAISESTRKLSDMMTNILKLNRLENQKIYRSSERYELGEQLCECLLQYESVWEAKGISIETDIEEGVFVLADAELLSLVWNNLFSNAFKFTERGGKVTVSLASEGECAVVKVADTGCGMTPEVGEHIFEKFYQGDSSRASEGNGLGLALVKRVVDITEGEIGVESMLGVGSSFTVKIERARDNAL